MNNLPLLSICVFWPLGGALLLAVCKPERAKPLALAVAALELLLTLGVVIVFDPERSGFQLLEDRLWIEALNVHYLLGVDGISLLFLPMTALLTLLAIAMGWRSVTTLQRFHLALLLALETATLGIFTALDLVLFFLFWELTLPPLFFLIGLWGSGAQRRYAAMKYTLYMLFGGVPLLFGFVLLALQHAEITGSLSFSLPQLLALPMSDSLQRSIFALLLLGFAVKAPLPPFHTWLPSVAFEAPAQITALLTGLKLGLYGIVRFAVPLAPEAAGEQRWLLAIVGAATLIYAGLIALQQTNLRRLLAYAGVSHVGLVLMGIAASNIQGLQGALMQMLNFGIAAAALMLLAGMLQQRLGSTDILHMGGLAKPMPRLTTLFIVFALSAIGVPGTNGFPAEWLLLWATVEAFPVLSVPVLFAAVVGAAYSLGFIRRGFFGPAVREAVSNGEDLLPRELAILAVPALLVLWLGLFPQHLLSIQAPSITAWTHRLQPQQTQILTATAKPLP